MREGIAGVAGVQAATSDEHWLSSDVDVKTILNHQVTVHDKFAYNFGLNID